MSRFKYDIKAIVKQLEETDQELILEAWICTPILYITSPAPS